MLFNLNFWLHTPQVTHPVTLCISTNNHENTIHVDFGATNKCWGVVDFTNTNNEFCCIWISVYTQICIYMLNLHQLSLCCLCLEEIWAMQKECIKNASFFLDMEKQWPHPPCGWLTGQEQQLPNWCIWLLIPQFLLLVYRWNRILRKKYKGGKRKRPTSITYVDKTP